jgi:hypothetical protein
MTGLEYILVALLAVETWCLWWVLTVSQRMLLEGRDLLKEGVSLVKSARLKITELEKELADAKERIELQQPT